MRKTVAALFVTLVALLGMWVPSASAAYVSNAKVVIIVGAVHGQTDTYRQRGNAAYAEAIKYTPNVTKVYSPNATWSKVKSATKGANVVIYMGHGNGWPSPYAAPDSTWSTKDGFGLNATAGDGDYNNKYYGEPYVDDLELASNAIILLHHLCYASGNSEPGKAEPSTSTAKARVDNYGAGFLRGRARAVIADGHMGAAYYLRALFTTNQSVLSLWRNAPNYNGNEFSFSGTRSAGYRAYMDPDSVGKGFYRSLVGKSTLTTREITGVVADTGLDPGTFVVPGRASVGSLGAELLAGDGSPTGTTLPADTRLKLQSRPNWTAADGAGVFEVAGLDDQTISGFVRGTQLVPRDSAAPIAIAADDTPTSFSPNVDGTSDTSTLSARYSETVDWTLRVTDADGEVVAESGGRAKEPAIAWDGLVDGVAVSDGTYRYTFSGQDAWLNAPAPVAISGAVKVDTTPPVLSSVPEATDPPSWFTPNGDGSRDAFTLSGTISEAGRVNVRVRDAADTTVRSFSTAVSAGAFSVAWNGRDNEGVRLPDGTYTVRLTPVDGLGNVGSPESRPVRIVTMLGFVRSSKTLFYPQDKDGLSSKTVLSFVLERPATVTWTIRSATGGIVDTLVAAELPAGTYTRSFYGRRTDGSMLPVGKYTSHVSVTDGVDTVGQAAGFQMNAFAITTSTSTPRRGRTMTVYALPAEGLDSGVRLTVYQPGLSSWSVSMKKLSTGRYRAYITLKSGGTSGTLKLRVRGTDTKGNLNTTYLSLPLS